MGDSSDLTTLARSAAGLSQVGLGLLLGVSQATVSRWEKGSPVPEYQRMILERICSNPKQNLSVVNFLVRNGRIADALFVVLGGKILIAGGDDDPL